MTGDVDSSAAILLLGIFGFAIQKVLVLFVKDLRKDTARLKERVICSANGKISISVLEKHDELDSLPLFYRDLCLARFLKVPVLLISLLAFAAVIWILVSGLSGSVITMQAFKTGLIVTLSSAAVSLFVVTYIERTNTRLEDLCRD